MNLGDEHYIEKMRDRNCQKITNFYKTGIADAAHFLDDMPYDLAEGDPNIKDMTRAFKLTSEAKVRGVLEFLDILIPSISNQKIVVFAYHRKHLDSLEAYAKNKIGFKSYIRIDGSTCTEKR